MQLERIQAFLKARGTTYQYTEEDGCGSIDFLHRGLSYHIWEAPAEDGCADSNVRTAGRMETYEGDYEDQILEILKTW